jgi:hypothetical protein
MLLGGQHGFGTGRFEEGLLSGLKLVGCSVWRSKNGEAPTVLVPSRSYATAGGIRYFELLRASEEGASPNDPAARLVVRKFKDHIKDEYQRIEALPAEPAPESATEKRGRSKAAAG